MAGMSEEPRPSSDALTRDEAAARAGRVGGVEYRLRLWLAAGSATYAGRLTAEFDVLPGDSPLWLDYAGGEVSSLFVDGERATPDRAANRLRLHGLAPGRHTVHVEYESPFDASGVGFHRFVDPEDGREYLYTDFEPYNAHRLFPCFDQPDVKATYEVSVAAPTRFRVISSGLELGPRTLDDGRVLRRFARTPPFSTYLLAVIAGDYAVREARGGDVPMRVFCRRSLERYLDADAVLDLTARGLRFYADYFAQPYPFTKYDQVFVPEFNAGAMENVAAVTLGEHLIFRGQTNRGERLNRAETLLHELAHMWFGNLVTMRWWDDLWLNESFATYISYRALVAAGYADAWEQFRAKIKDWAFREDELETTHPIAGDVPDTAATFLNFDGITYGKGAAVLKQLVAFVGEEAFRAGLRAYFARHAFGNTTLPDFLAALGEAAGADLADWSRRWIEGTGLDVLRPRLDVDGDGVAALAVEQEPSPRDGVHRPHRIEVALYGRDAAGRLAPTATRSVLVDGARAEVPDVAGLPRPELVVLDRGDHTYAKVHLDPASLETVRAELEAVDDGLVRQQMWGTLWSMVRDQRLGSLEFLDLVARRTPRERSAEVVDTVLDHARVGLVLYLPEELRRPAQARLMATAWAELVAARDVDRRLVWLRQTVGLASTREDFRRLLALADGGEELPGVVLDQPLRWDLLVRLAAFGHPEAPARLRAEEERDPSDKGRKSAFAVRVARPDPMAKASAWGEFTGPERSGRSDDFLKAGMSRFHWTHQRELLLPYAEAFFGAAREVQARGNQEYAASFFRSLFPPYPDERVVGLAREFVATCAEPSLRRLAVESLCELERALACQRHQRALAAG